MFRRPTCRWPRARCAPVGEVSHAGSGGEALQLAHRAQIEPKLDALAQDLGAHCLSDFSFSNLYLFRAAHNYRLHPGPWPGLSGCTYDAQTHFFPLFNARHAPVAVLDDLLAQFDCLYPLAACHLPDLHHPAWQLTASRDDADYLYPAAQFIAYRGRRLQKKRNLMRQLTSLHRMVSVPLQGGVVDQALVVLDQWLRHKGKRAGDADDAPCREALAHRRAFGFEGRLYLADDQPAGFVLAQPLQAGAWAVRFAKGNDQFKGIYQHMFHAFARELGSRATWFNFEQDMGLAGFRQAKLSYQPAALLPKYRLRAESPLP